MSTLRFCRRTVIAALEVLEHFNQPQLTRFVLKLGPDYSRWVAGESLSVSRRVNSLIALYDEDPQRLTHEGEFLADVLVEAAVARLPSAPSFAFDAEPPHPLRRALALDGFVEEEGVVRPGIPQGFARGDAEDEITKLLREYGFGIPLGHLEQALSAHSRGDWAAANGQIRTFFDALLDETAARIDPDAAGLPSGQPRRARLAGRGFLFRELNEWGDDGRGFVNGLMSRLHPHGAHPGLSDEEDSTFRMHVVLITARLLLIRFARGPASAL